MGKFYTALYRVHEWECGKCCVAGGRGGVLINWRVCIPSEQRRRREMSTWYGEWVRAKDSIAKTLIQISNHVYRRSRQTGSSSFDMRIIYSHFRWFCHTATSSSAWQRQTDAYHGRCDPMKMSETQIEAARELRDHPLIYLLSLSIWFDLIKVALIVNHRWLA